MGESSGVPMKEGARFFARPSTQVGRWSAWLLIVSIVLIVLNSAVVMPATESASGLESVQRVINLGVFLCLAAAGAAGATGIVAKRERSWVAFVAFGLFALGLLLNLASLFE